MNTPLDPLFANYLDPLIADPGTIERAVRLTKATETWPAFQNAVALLRASDVLALNEHHAMSVKEIAEALGVTAPRIYAIAATARKDPDAAENAQLPEPYDKLAPLTDDPGTLERALRLTEVLAAMNGLKKDLALMRASDVLTLHRRDGITYDQLGQELGLTAERTQGIATLAKEGGHVRRVTYKRRLPAEPSNRAAPHEATKAVTEAMATMDGPFSTAELVEASGCGHGQVSRVLKQKLATGELVESGPAPTGKGGRNVKTFTVKALKAGK